MLNLLFQYYNCEIIIFRIQRLYTITHVPLLVHGNENIKFRFPNRCWLDSIFVSQLWNYYFQNSELVLLGFHFWIVFLLIIASYRGICAALPTVLLRMTLTFIGSPHPPLKLNFQIHFICMFIMGFLSPFFYWLLGKVDPSENGTR